MSTVRVTVPATSSNLGPGYDCLGLALHLHNVVELSTQKTGLTLDIHGEGTHTLPRHIGNLVTHGATSVFRRTGYAPSGLHVVVESNIPPGGGLGSSAAALLGGIIAANVLIGSPLNRDEMLRLAVGIEGHPEGVTTALLGGLVISSYDGKDLIYRSVPVEGMRVVVALPDVEPGVPKPNPPETVKLEDAAFNIGRTALMVEALVKGDYDLLRRSIGDRLHEPFRSRCIPAYQWAVKAAYKYGAAGVTISGSGPALLAFAPDNHDQIAEMMARAFREGARVEARTWILPIDTQGISISEIGVPLRGGQPVPVTQTHSSPAPVGNNGQQ